MITAVIFLIASVMLAGACHGQGRTATENFVTNKIREAVTSLENSLTNEIDLAALRLYHYGSTDIIESPAEWFQFDAETGTITGFNYEAGRENVVVPWAIDGVSVTTIGNGTFAFSSVLSVVFPDSISILHNDVFNSCESLGYVSFGKNIKQIGILFCVGCDSLTNVVYKGSVPVFGDGAFSSIYGSNPKIYVANPQAKNWPDNIQGVPVVRPDLYADNLYQGGQRVATEAHVATSAVQSVNGTAFGLSLYGTTTLRDPYDKIRIAENEFEWTEISRTEINLSLKRIYGGGGMGATTWEEETYSFDSGDDKVMRQKEVEALVNNAISAIPEPSPYLPQQNTATNLVVRLVASNDWIMAIGEIQ